MSRILIDSHTFDKRRTNLDSLVALFNGIFGTKPKVRVRVDPPGEDQSPMIDAGYKAPPPPNAWRGWVATSSSRTV